LKLDACPPRVGMVALARRKISLNLDISKNVSHKAGFWS
jgi:hypothetical protein